MQNKSSGLGLLAVLQIIFIVLKLVHVVEWSWWAVFIPLWIDIGLVIIIGILLFFISKYRK